MDVKGVNVDLF